MGRRAAGADRRPDANAVDGGAIGGRKARGRAVPEKVALRVMEQDRAPRLWDPLLREMAKGREDLAHRLACGDHLQDPGMALQGLFRFLAVVDVFRGPVPEHDRPGLVAAGGRARAAPAIAAVGGPDPVFALIGFAGSQAFAPRLDEARQVVGIDQLDPAAADQLFRRLADPFRPAGTDLDDVPFGVRHPWDLAAQLESITIQAFSDRRSIPLGHEQIFARSAIGRLKRDVVVLSHSANRECREYEINPWLTLRDLSIGGTAQMVSFQVS